MNINYGIVTPGIRASADTTNVYSYSFLYYGYEMWTNSDCLFAKENNI